MSHAEDCLKIARGLNRPFTCPEVISIYIEQEGLSKWAYSSLRAKMQHALTMAAKYGLYEKIGYNEKGHALWKVIK